MTKQEIRSWLSEEAEEGYQKFSSSLIPGCEPMLGRLEGIFAGIWNYHRGGCGKTIRGRGIF